VTKKTRTVTLY